MVKLIGALLIISSLFALAVGAFIDLKYGVNIQITGNVITNIITQPEVNSNFADYLAAAAFSYSIISFIMGVVFLVRV